MDGQCDFNIPPNSLGIKHARLLTAYWLRVLGKLSVPVVLLIQIIVGQEHTALAAGADGWLFGHFFLYSIISFVFLLPDID